MPKKRGNGEGSLIRRKTGLWQAALTTGRDPQTGKLTRAYFYAKTRQQAAGKLAEALHTRQLGLLVQPSRLTVGAWLDTWLTTYKQPTVRPVTLAGYAWVIRKHLRPALGHLSLQALRADQVQQHYTRLRAEGLAPRSVRQVHGVLHAALQQALQHHLVARNVSSLVTVPQGRPPTRQTLTLPQVRDILWPAIRTHRLAAAILLAFTAGLRRGEVLGLPWAAVDLTAGHVQVRQTLVRVRLPGAPQSQLLLTTPKTAQGHRTVPLPRLTTQALQQHQQQQTAEKAAGGAGYTDQGLVFCTASGGALDPRFLGRVFRQALVTAGLPPIRLHDARHTFATWLLEHGIAPKVVQTLLGHTSIRITLDIYTHVSLVLEEQAAQTLHQALTQAGVAGRLL